MRILLTGGSGYIASKWLCTPLARQSTVTTLKRRIPDVKPDDVIKGADVVVHLAAATPTKRATDAALLDTVNHQWTAALAGACVQAGVKLLFPSTSGVFSDAQGALLKEDAPCAPQNAYATSKLAAEQVLHTLRDKGLQYAILRMGSVFGAAPKINFERPINRFVAEAMSGKPVEVWQSALDQLRPYTHVGDAAHAINFAIEQNLFSGETYHIVSENATIRSVLGEIEKHIPVTLKTVTSSLMNDFSFGMDGTKIRSLGFVPEGTVARGVEELVRTLADTKHETHTQE